MDSCNAYTKTCLDIGPDEDDISVKVVEPKDWKYYLFGTLDWTYMCMPKWPYCTGGKVRSGPIFFARKEWLGVLTAMVVGLQHALAMVGGLIVPPTLIVPFGVPNRTAIIAYLVQAALIVCGIMTAVQVTSISFFGKNPKYPMWGAGILSVMGVSFTSVPVATAVLPYLIAQGNTFQEAYGMYLGTICFTSLTPFIFVFLPIKAIKKIFPPVVSGVTIMLIGIHLTGAGMANWGGGAFCGQNYLTVLKCAGNGEVALPFGSKPYVGLGFLVFVTIIFVEIFGSPFFRNCSAITGLLLGYIVAAGSEYGGSKYVTNANFENAPGITFLWTTKFPLGFYAPAIIPMMIVAIITSIETVGDTTATMEASRLATIGPLYNRRLQGALLNDAVSGLFSALATSLPLTTFAQNNGVITLTNVASRQAGWWCAGFLFLLGCLGKFGAWVVSIPNCVLGGMTTFLFANIISSGIKIITTQGNLDRRTRFIMACALALGVGVELYPQWASKWLWPIDPPALSSALQGVRQAIIICLTTSFTIGAITAFILNLIMPDEAVDPGQTAYELETSKLRADEIMAAAAVFRDESVAPTAPKGAWAGAVAEADEAPTQPVMTV